MNGAAEPGSRSDLPRGSSSLQVSFQIGGVLLDILLLGMLGGFLYFLLRKKPGEAASAPKLSAPELPSLEGWDFPVASSSPSRMLAPKRLPAPSLMDFPVKHTNLDNVVVGTSAKRVVQEMFTDTKLNLVNSSAANNLRIGSHSKVLGGGGMPLPPGQIIRITLRANTELWAGASDNTNLGISIEDV
jgi:hypothetical protein